MGYQPFLIANTRIGMERDVEPFLLPNDAYPDLEDCYLWRGRVKKRRGFRLLGRLNTKIGTTNGGGALTVTLPNVPLIPGTTQIQVIQTIGGVSTVLTTFQDPRVTSGGDPVTMLVNGTGSATLNRATSTLVITGSNIAIDVFYFPGLPVMGLRTLETTIDNEETLIAFDTRYAYTYDNSVQKFVDMSTYKTAGTEFVWSGADSDFFWTTNYSDAFWATNNIAGFQSTPTASIVGRGDGIRWHDQTIGTPGNGWVNFLPPIESTNTNFLTGALIILPYKGRLICFNTFEGPSLGGSTNFEQRARWSQIGTPYYNATVPTGWGGGFNADGWWSNVNGKGGFIDAPTSEAIISAEFVKDTLLVYFERSTWQFVYTGDPSFPFFWQKINTELGAESTFSIVPFDRTAIAIGDVGIHECDTVNVQRIDQRDPDIVFEIQNSNNGPKRAYGIRDYFNQLVYWTFPYIGRESAPTQGLIYPNKVFVYNYIDKSFSFFNDSFTCFGYYQNNEDRFWNNTFDTWEEADFNWIDPAAQSFFPLVVGGNQQGFVEILMQRTVNDEEIFISQLSLNLTTKIATISSPNHNYFVGDFLQIVTASGITGLTGKIFKVETVPDVNTLTINFSTLSPQPSGVFTGSGTIEPVNNISILSKKFNPFLSEGTQVRLGYADFYFDKTTDGQVTVNLFLDEDTTYPVNPQNNTINTFAESTYTSSPSLPPFVPSKIWKRIYFYNISQLFQYQVTLSDAEMMNPDLIEADIVLHGVIFWFSKSGRLIDV